uniref:Uncharacterized protein n=1 Tax=uncultured gamma proteobacterium HF0070_08D07 TaxID=710983 RepID=E0XRV9_9GAMM|nr:hypothetical protein [uncultured gamma proteobacterium HF0070_08D07]
MFQLNVTTKAFRFGIKKGLSAQSLIQSHNQFPIGSYNLTLLVAGAGFEPTTYGL